VLPAFNEAANIEEAVLRCAAVADEMGFEYEVIVVDDGSYDGTRERVESLASSHQGRIRSLHHPQNRGYGAALKTGLLSARMDRVFFTDADLQFDVAEISRLLQHADRYDIVCGYRAPRRDPAMRVFNGWAWSKLVGGLFGLSVRDVDCAFKVFDRCIFERIAIHSIGAFVNTEILVRARAAGFSVVEVPVTHYPRLAGDSSGANPRVIARAFKELALLYRELKVLEDGSMASEERELY